MTLFFFQATTKDSDFQSVVSEPVASTSPEILLEMQMLRIAQTLWIRGSVGGTQKSVF